MRLHFSDTLRPKTAAKRLAAISSRVKLSAAQEALARVLGYRDWHELEKSVHPDVQTPPKFDHRAVAIKMILKIVDQLGLPDGDVQFVLSKSRLITDGGWTIDDNLAIRAAIWRERVFGAPARGKPGTVIRAKSDGDPVKAAYLCRSGQASLVMFETGLGHRADFEVVTPRAPLPDFVPARLWLPYGYWTLDDGSEVIYSRDYLPMWRVEAGRIERLEPWYWITTIVKNFNFAASLGRTDWASGPVRALALDHSINRHIRELPRLVDAMPHLFDPDVDSIDSAVKRLRKNDHREPRLPSYARQNLRLVNR